MELEHTNLGQHCEVPDCNERDFLPFKCDVCFRSFCLLHRTYTAHSCSGANSKDMTSLDCPICGNSVKFSKAESPDIVWDQHYTTSCAGTQSVKKPTKCYEKSCSTSLGPSNTFNCPKCKQNVCLSHRFPEDHNCKGTLGSVQTKINADKVPLKSTQTSSATTGFVAAKTIKLDARRPSTASSSSGSDEIISAKGGAAISGREKQQAAPREEESAPTPSGSPSDSFSCLLCAGSGSGAGDCTIS